MEAPTASRSERVLVVTAAWFVARRLRAHRPIVWRDSLEPRVLEAMGLAADLARAAEAELRTPFWTRAALARARDEWLCAPGGPPRLAALGSALVAAAEQRLAGTWERIRVLYMARAGRCAGAPTLVGDVWTRVAMWLAAAAG